MTADITEGGRTGKLFEMIDKYRTGDEIEVLAEAFDDLSKKTRQYIIDITRITKEKERIDTELDLARRIQADMLPGGYPAFPDRDEFDIYATMTPAKEVGGDFYDFFLIDGDHLGMVMADVSGKGVPAALFMMMSKILIGNYAAQGGSPAKVLEQTNSAICKRNDEEMFVTVWFGVLEISTGKITAANAGHEFPVIRTGGGDYELFRDKHGFVIGGMDGMKYKEYELTLEKGGTLFLYTDGVPEATNAEKELFGTDRLIEVMNENKDCGPKELLPKIKERIDEFVGDADQFDDLTMLAIKLM
jgi:sigma-B regulation protein RsbU (phosphoserine phosphatase)